jgi:WD40 repeat protein
VFSPDGRWIVSASDDTLTVWDAETGAEIRTLVGDPGAVACRFSPDKRWIVSTSDTPRCGTQSPERRSAL